MTYSIMELESTCFLVSRHRSPSFSYNRLFSHSSAFSMEFLVRLERQTTGHRLQPRVQQQHKQPQNSHLTLTGSVFLRTVFIRPMVALNSSGATRPVRLVGNSVSNRLLKPNTVTFPPPLIMMGSGTVTQSASPISVSSSKIISKSAILNGLEDFEKRMSDPSADS